MRACIQKAGLGLMAIAVAALAMTGSAAALDPALQDGLVANWSFDGNELDNLGGANGTLVGGTYVAGKLGSNAINFTGVTGQGVTIGTPTSLDLTTNACTIAAWVQLDVLPNASLVSTPSIFDSVLDGYVMYVDKGNNEIRFKANSANSTNTVVGTGRPGVADTTKFDTTNWHYCVGTYDGSYLKFYYDGQLMDSLGISKVGGTHVQTGQIAGIGYQPPSGTTAVTGWLKGSVDEVAVWNRAVNPDEISYLYNGGAGRTVMSTNPTIAPPAPPAMPNPIVHLALDGNVLNSGTGGAAYNGTLIDRAGGTNAYEAGKIGSLALHLMNGAPPGVDAATGDCVSVPYTLTSEEGTISFWCKPDGPWFSYMNICDNSVNNQYWEMYVDVNGVVAWRTSNTSPQYTATYDLDNAGGIGTWKHITAVWRKSAGSGTPGKTAFDIYINGELAAGGDGPASVPGSTFYLGGGMTGNKHFIGTFDDLRIFDKALTPDQIREVYEIPEPGALVLLVSALLAFGIRGRKTV